MPVLIRPGVPEDAPSLTALARRAKASWGYPEEWLAAWREELEITPEYVARHHVLVAETDGALSGVATLETTAEAVLGHLWVDPLRQRRGVGSALVRRALELAAGLGCRTVGVVADPNARGFYERLGARPVGSHPAPMPGAPGRTLPVLRFALTAGGRPSA